MPNPTISIVTTVYDAKDYIPRTVRSILAQSFTDFELLLVEDGSPNGCGELCDALAKTDPRIRVFHKENGGPASALNVGLDNARGDYIGFVDSDDLVDPDLYETLLNVIRENDVRIAVCDYETARKFNKAAEAAGKKGLIHLAADTGMTRIGFKDSEESLEEIRRIAALPNVEIEGLFTHFARADEYDRTPAMVQLKRYLDFADLLEKNGIHIPLHHCSNSAGIIRVPEANLNIVRAGITIYGIYPSEEVEKDIVMLKPVMSLKSHVSYVKDVEPGVQVSYGGTYTTDHVTKMATIPVGYADGYPRQLSNKGWVLIHGKKAPILGRVCMDQFMADVTEIDNVKKGDEVTLLGRDGDEFISIEEMGDLCGRFSYEFACDISPRVPRVYIKDGKEAEVWYQGQKVF
mgnify:CR=1 FL=1